MQGNVDQAQKWDVSRSVAIFAEYLKMTRQAIGRGAAFVIWPESSTPFFFEDDLMGAAQLRTLAQGERRADSVRQRSDRADRHRGRARVDKDFNSAFLVRADGTTGGVYRKMHLVPFGEYVPLKDLLFFVGAARRGDRPTSRRATEPTLLPVGGHRVSTAICYEVIYPDLVRRFVRGGSELLTTITNDAWFGPTSAPYQHFEQASMRAIEEGRYLVRAANTGISGIVDPYGRVLERSRHLQPAVIVGDARFLTTTTVYARIGDVFAYASVAADAGPAGLAGGAAACTDSGHADRRRFDAPLRGSQQTRCRSAELSLRPPAPTKN